MVQTDVPSASPVLMEEITSPCAPHTSPANSFSHCMFHCSFQLQGDGLENELNNQVFAILFQSNCKEVGELLHEQLYRWVVQNREYVPTAWTPFLLQGVQA